MSDIIRIFSTLIALIGASGSLHADTITVCPDGTCDFASVDEAITAAAHGDRIEIGSGAYDISQHHDLEERRIEIVGVAEPDEPAPRLQLTNNVSWLPPRKSRPRESGKERSTSRLPMASARMSANQPCGRVIAAPIAERSRRSDAAG